MKLPPVHEQIKTGRLLAGLTQAELAELCGFPNQSAVSRLEKGDHAARVDTLFVVARALRIDLVISWRTVQ
jgi:transcriptional regulator with XRE-family HTH domain